MKKFVYAHIKPGNIIVTDSWGAYIWLDTDNNYIHSVHNHNHGDFGYGQERTSHIESVLGNLKSIY